MEETLKIPTSGSNTGTTPPAPQQFPLYTAQCRQPPRTPGHTPQQRSHPNRHTAQRRQPSRMSQQCPRLNRRAAQRRKPPRTPRYIPGQTPQHRSRSNCRATQCRQYPRAQRHTPQQCLRPKCCSPSSTRSTTSTLAAPPT